MPMGTKLKSGQLPGFEMFRMRNKTDACVRFEKRCSTGIIEEFHPLMCKRDSTAVHSPGALDVATNLVR